MVTVDDALFKNYSIGPKKQAYRKVTDLPVKECHQRLKTLMVQAFSSGGCETAYLHEIKNISKNISKKSGPRGQFLSSGK